VPTGALPLDAVAVAGLGGALEPTLAPGDLVVAGRVIDSAGKEVARLASAELLAAELARLGLRARIGTVVSTDHLVRGGERAELAGLGAEVVDMESTAIVAASWGVPLAVLRAVSDSPGAELFSAASARGIAAALRSLRAARPALAVWAAEAGPKEVFLAEPRARIGVTTGARAPEEPVAGVVDSLGGPGPVNLSKRSTGAGRLCSPLRPDVRETPPSGGLQQGER
jgi:4-hydroxy-3-methylbut-2-enyl diphosphate reductase